MAATRHQSPVSGPGGYRYLASRTQERRSPGAGRLMMVGARAVTGVILFVSVMRLLVQ